VALIEETRSEPAVQVATLPPLAPADCERLVANVFNAKPDEAFTNACRHASGGNPFLLNELARSLIAEGAEPSERFAARAEATSPAAVSRSVFRRMAQMTPQAQALAIGIAILGEHADIPTASAIAGLSEADALSSADALRAGGVLAEGDSLQFLHPIIRETVYADIPSGKRSALHEQAADLILSNGGDAERTAAHLHQIEPRRRNEHAACLRAAAQTALALGAPDGAARHLRRALEDVEDRGGRRAVLVELGWAETWAQTASAPERFREALDLIEDAAERIELVRGLAHSLALRARIDDAIGVITAELGSSQALPRPERVRLEADLAGALLFGNRVQLEELDSRLEKLRNELTENTSAVFDLKAAMAYRLVQRGENSADARALAEEIGATPVEDALFGGVTSSALSITLLETGALATLHQVAEMGLERGREMGAPFPVALNLDLLAVIEYRRGALARAEAMIYEAVHLAREYGIHVGLPIALTGLVDTLVALGKPDEAWHQLELDDLTGPLPELFGFAYLMEARSRLQMLSGDPENALADALEAGERMRQSGITGAAGTRWRSDAACARLRLGERVEAVRLAEEDLLLARKFGEAWPIGYALRTLGVARGGESGLALIRESESVLSATNYPLELARTQIELGASLRRAGSRREAREPLRAALDSCVQMGAKPDAKRAQEELAATGARPRSLVQSGIESLTPSEYRVAQLAADGMTNREVAQSLFVTTKTVETHLGHVYAKLKIAGRRELQRALGGE
jgi:ATP/maltotriose-dependent transcriptional regulator MalT